MNTHMVQWGINAMGNNGDGNLMSLGAGDEYSHGPKGHQGASNVPGVCAQWCNASGMGTTGILWEIVGINV